MTPPIRFLAMVVGGWTIVRAAMLITSAQPTTDDPAPSAVATVMTATTDEPTSIRKQVGSIVLPPPRRADIRQRAVAIGAARRRAVPVRWEVARIARIALPAAFPRPTRAPARDPAGSSPVLPSMPTRMPELSRWSGSMWMLARGASAAAFASGGSLGGSQAGARVLFRVNDNLARPVSLSMRVSSPLGANGVEAAAGLEWQPFANVPVRVLAERRQRISGGGRSAFALLAHGGVSALTVAGLRLDAYAQAGVVGVRSRDMFADAGATLVRPIDADGPDGLAAGVGAWGGVQPGASRIDIGPRLTTTLAAPHGRMRVSLDWRFRVGGDAAPGSGPSLTVATDF